MSSRKGTWHIAAVLFLATAALWFVMGNVALGAAMVAIAAAFFTMGQTNDGRRGSG